MVTVLTRKGKHVINESWFEWGFLWARDCSKSILLFSYCVSFSHCLCLEYVCITLAAYAHKSGSQFVGSKTSQIGSKVSIARSRMFSVWWRCEFVRVYVWCVCVYSVCVCVCTHNVATPLPRWFPCPTPSSFCLKPSTPPGVVRDIPHMTSFVFKLDPTGCLSVLLYDFQSKASIAFQLSAFRRKCCRQGQPRLVWGCCQLSSSREEQKHSV